MTIRLIRKAGSKNAMSAKPSALKEQWTLKESLRPSDMHLAISQVYNVQPLPILLTHVSNFGREHKSAFNF